MSIKVIGISGVAGSGKTTLINALHQTLKSTVVSWDDFDEISISPIDNVAWFNQGENYNEWDYQKLADVLKALKSNQKVTHPTLKHLLQPTEYVLFDAPLGRCHIQTKKYIDISIHIEVPLDISLCRRVIRDFKGDERSKEDLVTELEYYLSHARPLFFDNDLKASADLVINGMLTTKEQVQEIIHYLGKEKL